MSRPPVERPMANAARRTAALAQAASAKAAAAKSAAAALEAALSALHGATERRFNMKVDRDPFLLDVLAMIDVRPGNVWHWTGARNNKGSATVRVDRNEVSLVRYLALAFGLISPTDYGVLYPTGDPSDVNPWHRSLRRSSSPVGAHSTVFRAAAS